MTIRTICALLAGAAVVTAACDTNPVGNLNQVVPGFTHDAFSARLGGVIYLQKYDFGTRINAMDSFGRAAANFVITDPRSITEWLGDGNAIENSTFYATANWVNQFAAIRNAVSLVNDLPNATPAYAAGDLAKMKGIVYTIEALSFMYAAETKDTLGVPIQGPLHASSAPAPILCSRDSWRFIVALLDSAFVQLNTDQSPGLPVALDGGFAAVNSQASPSTKAGSFAAFNRALAARANLELAYAIARSPGGTPPTLTTPGSPDVTALQRADSALHATFLYSTPALTPPSAGEFTDALAVYHLFSGQSGDVPNPLQATITTYYLLQEAVNVIDPADLRLRKFVPNATTALTAYNFVASPLTLSMYPSPASPIPIVRNEELHLYGAQIRLGLNDLAGAVAEINNVRTKVGGLPPVANPGTYTGVRDLILREYMASTTGEPSGDRVAAIRDYSLPTVADTTWDHVPNQGPDTHATVQPFPVSDVTARNGNTQYSCQ
jgi:starch-binding outer membrane protein, SusD/RagB family